jgi:hypothetical protein
MIGALCRQTVLFVPVGFALVALLNIKKRPNLQSGLVVSIVLLVLGILTVWLHDVVYAAHHGAMPANHGFQMAVIADEWTSPDLLTGVRLAFYSVSAFIFAGLCMLPLFINKLRKLSEKEFVVAVICFAIFEFRLFIPEQFWPFTGDVWHPNGVGAMLFEGQNSNHFSTHPALGTALAVLSAMVWGKILTRTFVTVPMMIAMLCIIPLAVSYLSDRYMLVAFVFFMIAALTQIKLMSNGGKYMWIMLLILALFSVNEQRYFHQSRYAALDCIREAENRFPYYPVSAGFEWNGWKYFNFEGYNAQFPERSFADDNTVLVSPADSMSGYERVYFYTFSDFTGLRTTQMGLWLRIDR